VLYIYEVRMNEWREETSIKTSSLGSHLSREQDWRGVLTSSRQYLDSAIERMRLIR